MKTDMIVFASPNSTIFLPLGISQRIYFCVHVFIKINPWFFDVFHIAHFGDTFLFCGVF